MAENSEAVEIALAPSLVVELERRWPPLGLTRRFEPAEPLKAKFGLSNEWLIVPDVEESGDSPPPAAWDLMESELTLFAVRRLTRLVAVHAAAIAHNGRVLVVPASPGGGKSTLTIAAAAAGAAVLSDEYTLIDPRTGLVTGWRRSVRRRRSDGTIERLDLAVRSEPMPVGLVAAVIYDPEADGRWKPISTAHATAELLSHTICSRTRPQDAFDAAISITRFASAVAGTRHGAEAAVAELLAVMDDQGR